MDKCLIAITLGFVNLWLANDMSIKKTYYGHCLRLPRGTSHAFQEKIEYTKIRSPKSKNRQQNGQKKKDKQWSRKHYTKPGVNSGTPDG